MEVDGFPIANGKGANKCGKETLQLKKMVPTLFLKKPMH
jgi:hypothetical protein